MRTKQATNKKVISLAEPAFNLLTNRIARLVGVPLTLLKGKEEGRYECDRVRKNSYVQKYRVS